MFIFLKRFLFIDYKHNFRKINTKNSENPFDNCRQNTKKETQENS